MRKLTPLLFVIVIAMVGYGAADAHSWVLFAILCASLLLVIRVGSTAEAQSVRADPTWPSATVGRRR